MDKRLESTLLLCCISFDFLQFVDLEFKTKLFFVDNRQDSLLCYVISTSFEFVQFVDSEFKIILLC